MIVVPLSIIVLKDDATVLRLVCEIDDRVVFDRTRVVVRICPANVEFRPLRGKKESKDTGDDFLLHGGLYESGFPEIGDGRESHPEEPRKHE